MGYVWCDGYVWDMSGVRYANNLLKNPATKRLSGKKVLFALRACYFTMFGFPLWAEFSISGCMTLVGIEYCF